MRQPTVTAATRLALAALATFASAGPALPYIAAIGIDSGASFVPLCGGTVLSSNFVLTAAHCVTDDLVASLVVCVGSLRPRLDDSVRVAAVALHPSFDAASLHMDLALLRLQTSLPGRVPVPTLPTAALSSYTGATALVMGWGATSEGGPAAGSLRVANVTVRSDCGGVPDKYVSSTMVCASADGTDACNGDSGGPLLVCRDGADCDIVAVTSWGIGCAQSQYPGVYALVSPARAWIDGMLRSPRPWPDCAGRDALGWEHRLGDGVCDSGAGGGVNFDCTAFGCDRGDCGASCCGGAIRDCNGASASAEWLGDGECDDGSAGIDFNCPEFGCDRGDCECPVADVKVNAAVLRRAFRAQCCGLDLDSCTVRLARSETE